MSQWLRAVADYYSRAVREHGATARGSDWKSDEAQLERFEALALLFDRERPEVLDYGCGWGAFRGFLRERFASFSYTGFDISTDMLETARQLDPSVRLVSELPAGEQWDFVVASGLFNVRLEASDEQWERHLFDTLHEFDRRARVGFAFNALTSYSDADRRANHLYYADPCRLADYCIRNFSRRVVLLHGRPAWDFAILVSKQA